MSGKQHKRDIKRAKQAAREEARRRERQRTIQTAIVVGIAVLIGAVLIFVSAREDAGVADPAATPTAAASPGGSEVAAAPDVPPCTPAPPPEDALAEGETKGTFPDGPEQVLEEGTDYRAVVETSCGRIVFDLFEQDAPETVNSFVFLAQQGFFDGLSIFRNAPGIAILQTGSGDDTNAYELGYTVPDEFGRAEAEGGYGPGALAMANTLQPDTGGSQFFMVYGASSLPPQYTLFGQAVEGVDVLQAIGAIPVEGETPTQDVYLESVTIETAPAGTPSAGPSAAPPASPSAGPSAGPSTTPTEESS